MFQLSTLTLAFTALVSFASASANDTVYVAGMGVDEVKRQLDISRYPALYTGNFDDCFAEESLFSIGRFDAGYYADNLTVVFHLNGITRVRNDSLMSKSSLLACIASTNNHISAHPGRRLRRNSSQPDL